MSRQAVTARQADGSLIRRCLIGPWWRATACAHNCHNLPHHPNTEPYWISRLIYSPPPGQTRSLSQHFYVSGPHYPVSLTHSNSPSKFKPKTLASVCDSFVFVSSVEWPGLQWGRVVSNSLEGDTTLADQPSINATITMLHQIHRVVSSGALNPVNRLGHILCSSQSGLHSPTTTRDCGVSRHRI